MTKKTVDHIIFEANDFVPTGRDDDSVTTRALIFYYIATEELN